MPSTPLLRTVLAAALALGFAIPSQAESRLRPASALPESQQLLLSDTTARAFDHVRAARREIAERRTFEARKELARASSLLDQARAASPATRVQEWISTLLIRLEDPTARVAADEFSPLIEAIVGSGDPEAFAATLRYAERARYYRADGDAASRELIAAAARVPYGEVDAPLASAFAQVNLAMIQLHAGRLEAAAAVLNEAEGTTLRAVRIAGGAHDDILADVAAPPAPELAEPEAPETMLDEPAATESEIPDAIEFSEPPATEPDAAEPAEGDASDLSEPETPQNGSEPEAGNEPAPPSI